MPMQVLMSVWMWVAVGVIALLAFAAVVALAVAAILGRIATQVAALLESEEWASAPVTREKLADDELSIRRTTSSARGNKIPRRK